MKRLLLILVASLSLGLIGCSSAEEATVSDVDQEQENIESKIYAPDSAESQILDFYNSEPIQNGIKIGNYVSMAGDALQSEDVQTINDCFDFVSNAYNTLAFKVKDVPPECVPFFDALKEHGKSAYSAVAYMRDACEAEIAGNESSWQENIEKSTYYLYESAEYQQDLNDKLKELIDEYFI